MSLGGFTLADRLGAKTVPCRVAGCSRTWIQLSNKALALGGGATAENDPAAGMCEPCGTKWKNLKDSQRRCDRPGCTGTWAWGRQDQIEAFATKRPPPKALCADCETKLAGLEEKQVPCVSPGCTRKAVLSKRAQLLALTAAESAAQAAPVEAEAPVSEETSADGVGITGTDASDGETDQHAGAPSESKSETPSGDGKRHGRNGNGKHGDGKHGKEARQPLPGVTVSGAFCAECDPIARKLRDRPVHCGINGCSRKWVWKADDQLQAFAAGKPNEPPRRMCDVCRANFGKLLDRDVRCRTSGCKLTWSWSRFDQLDACVADKAPPKAPSKMCERCFQTWSALKDVERPCRRGGCKGTWTDKRGGQLARAVRGKTGDPYPRYCVTCEKELGDLQDREITCKTESCTGTWTWTKEQQLAAGVRPKKFLEDEAKAEAKAEAEGAAAAVAPEAATAGEADADVPAGANDAAAAAETAAMVSEGGPAPADTAATQPTAAKAGKKRRRNKKRREIQPPERRCQACVEFLANRKTQEIPCSHCATPIYWPPESQLQTHLGNWAAPSMCGACKRDATEAARKAAKEQIRADFAHSVEAPGEHASGDAGSADAAAADAGSADAATADAAAAAPTADGASANGGPPANGGAPANDGPPANDAT